MVNNTSQAFGIFCIYEDSGDSVLLTIIVHFCVHFFCSLENKWPAERLTGVSVANEINESCIDQLSGSLSSLYYTVKRQHEKNAMLDGIDGICIYHNTIFGHFPHTTSDTFRNKNSNPLALMLRNQIEKMAVEKNAAK